jgi:uncharacterized membrane protein
MKRRTAHDLRKVAQGLSWRAMKQRTRKAIGTFATIAFMIVYALIAMAVGGQVAVGRGLAIELTFYVVAGLLWLPVVMALIRWMARPDEPGA